MDRSDKQKFWFEHIAAWQSSGVSQMTYCERHGLSFASLGYWIKRKRELLAERAELKLVPVRISPTQTIEALVLRSPTGWTLEIPTGSSVEYLTLVFRALS